MTARVVTVKPGISQKKLRDLRVFNEWDFTLQADMSRSVPVVVYVSDMGRAGRGQWWEAMKTGRNLHGKGAPRWEEQIHSLNRKVTGTKRVFSLFVSGATHAERKQTAFQSALDFVAETFGIEEWARTPFGGYAPAEFVRQRCADLKAAAS